MARIRSMKPEFRTSLTVTSWPRDVRQHFALLWGYLDDHGYGIDDARLIKADAWPLDDDITAETVEEWNAIIAGPTPDGRPGPLCRYTVAGRRYMHTRSWTEHQKPSHPGKAKYPPCPINHDDPDSGNSRETLGKPSGGSREDLTSISGGSRADVASTNGHAQVGVFARSSGGSPESARDLPETLRPEQGAVSSEQGAAARARARVRADSTPPPRRGDPPNDTAMRIVTDATDATDSEARQFIAEVMKRTDPPRNLPGFLRKVASDGDLGRQIERIRAENRSKNPDTHPYDDPGGVGICQRPAANGQPCGLRDNHSRHRVRVLHAVGAA